MRVEKLMGPDYPKTNYEWYRMKREGTLKPEWIETYTAPDEDPVSSWFRSKFSEKTNNDYQSDKSD